MKEDKLVEKQLNENKDDNKDGEIERLRAQLAVSNESLDEAKKQLKFAPKPAPLPESQKALPKGMQDSGMVTTVKNLSNFIEEKMIQLKDLSTMELLVDTNIRMKKRIESIREMGSAQHIKIRNKWKTTAPKMHISGLEGKKINNDEYEISFGVFQMDDKGEKVLYTHYAEFLLHDGSRINRPTSAEHRIAYEVVERIKTGKAITREVIKIDSVQGGDKDDKNI